jgi:hypothetical protein
MGLCTFTGLRAGTYEVRAQTEVGDGLLAAIREGIRVPATGREDVRLALQDAIRIHEYMPSGQGSRWWYEGFRCCYNTGLWIGFIRWFEEVEVLGSARFAGRDVTELEHRLSRAHLTPLVPRSSSPSPSLEDSTTGTTGLPLYHPSRRRDEARRQHRPGEASLCAPTNRGASPPRSHPPSSGLWRLGWNKSKGQLRFANSGGSVATSARQR